MRRRRLAAEMRKLRKEAGKTREEAARYADIAPATVSRIEAAAHAPKVADIMALCRFYGLDEAHTEMLVTLARQSRQRGWWQKVGEDAIPAWFETYVGLEEEVAEIRSYQPEVIFGLLQTEDYARAVLTADDTVGPAEGERRLEVRMRRQKLLEEPDRPKLWIIQNEGALRRHVGGVATMQQQLKHLIDLSRQPGITIQVLPFSAGAHPSMHGAFEILSFPERYDPDVVYIDYRRGSIYLENLDEVDDYTQLFDQLRARAISPDGSRALIGRIIQEMDAS
ncbi:helix-turn-helix domain-containing protein [Thermomonospora curvata]|uniref:helix-turn-helix domain-containing protein n=1 Tax=Thermomonospora curvata TaxID=2020 RepID=UPI00247864B0|nr:helix-turn-helix transcriptional regulator [Thermomonospora curvata]